MNIKSTRPNFLLNKLLWFLTTSFLFLTNDFQFKLQPYLDSKTNLPFLIKSYGFDVVSCKEVKYLTKSEYEELTSREFEEHYLYVNLALDEFNLLTVDLNLNNKDY